MWGLTLISPFSASTSSTASIAGIVRSNFWILTLPADQSWNIVDSYTGTGQLELELDQDGEEVGMQMRGEVNVEEGRGRRTGEGKV